MELVNWWMTAGRLSGPRCAAGNGDLPHRRARTVVVEADAAQLSVALRAICQNALEALNSGGHIEVRIERRQRDARIRLRDDGPGIKPEERRHIFDPFYSARQAGRGLGLGLSKAWRIITNHGGRTRAASEPGHGATFTIVLPIKERETPRTERDAQPGTLDPTDGDGKQAAR